MTSRQSRIQGSEHVNLRLIYNEFWKDLVYKDRAPLGHLRIVETWIISGLLRPRSLPDR